MSMCFVVLHSHCGDPGYPVRVCSTIEIAARVTVDLTKDCDPDIDSYYIVECEWVSK